MPLISKIIFMQTLMSIFLFMLASSLVMIGYVWIRDIRHKKLHPVEIAEGEKIFEEIQPAETVSTEYEDLRQKTA